MQPNPHLVQLNLGSTKESMLKSDHVQGAAHMKSFHKTRKFGQKEKNPTNKLANLAEHSSISELSWSSYVIMVRICESAAAHSSLFKGQRGVCLTSERTVGGSQDQPCCQKLGVRTVHLQVRLIRGPST